MDLKGINNTSSISKIENKVAEKRVNLSQSPDSFEKNELNLEDIVQALDKAADNKDEPKLQKSASVQKKELISFLAKHPEIFESIQKITQNPRISGNELLQLLYDNQVSEQTGTVAYASKEEVAAISFFAESKTEDGTYKYSGKDLLQFKKIGADIVKAKPLAKTSLPTEQMVKFIEQAPLSENELDLEKLADKIVETEKANKAFSQGVYLSRDEYEPENPIISTVGFDNRVKRQVLDKNIKTKSIEEECEYRSESGTRYKITKAKDLRTGIISKVRSEYNDKLERFITTHEIRIVKDKSNKTVRTEYLKPSEVKGVFDIFYEYPDGKKEIVSSGSIDKKTGTITVRKNMTSPEGTKTNYLYEDDPDGNRITDYKITDKKGNVLLNISRTFEVVDDNTFISSLNNKKHKIIVDKSGVKVEGITNPDEFAKMSTGFFFGRIRGDKKKILDVLKQMPGDEIIRMESSVSEVLGGTSNGFYPNSKKIKTSGDLFAIMHELGHAKDGKGFTPMSEDKQLNTVFEKEKEKFCEVFPEAQKKHLNYFMNILTHYDGKKGGLQETIAEANAILTTPKPFDALAMRVQYLQQYFPETIAYLASKLEN